MGAILVVRSKNQEDLPVEVGWVCESWTLVRYNHTI